MTRDAIRQLVDDLDEHDLPTAERLLRALRDTGGESDPFLQALANAPFDDEPETEEERAAVAEARQELLEGHGIPHEEVKRRWGLP
jgi:hypothetical protein